MKLSITAALVAAVMCVCAWPTLGQQAPAPAPAAPAAAQGRGGGGRGGVTMGPTKILFITKGHAFDREGLFQMIAHELQESAPQAMESFKPVMKKIYQKHDWQEYGGAPLLGVGGYSLICHGRSDAKAIKNAIRVGKQLVKSKINEHIIEKIAKSIEVEE